MKTFRFAVCVCDWTEAKLRPFVLPACCSVQLLAEVSQTAFIPYVITFFPHRFNENAREIRCRRQLGAAIDEQTADLQHCTRAGYIGAKLDCVSFTFCCGASSSLINRACGRAMSFPQWCSNTLAFTVCTVSCTQWTYIRLLFAASHHHHQP